MWRDPTRRSAGSKPVRNRIDGRTAVALDVVEFQTDQPPDSIDQIGHGVCQAVILRGVNQPCCDAKSVSAARRFWGRGASIVFKSQRQASPIADSSAVLLVCTVAPIHKGSKLWAIQGGNPGLFDRWEPALVNAYTPAGHRTVPARAICIDGYLRRPPNDVPSHRPRNRRLLVQTVQLSEAGPGWTYVRLLLRSPSKGLPTLLTAEHLGCDQLGITHCVGFLIVESQLVGLVRTFPVAGRIPLYPSRSCVLRTMSIYSRLARRRGRPRRTAPRSASLPAALSPSSDSESRRAKAGIGQPGFHASKACSHSGRTRVGGNAVCTRCLHSVRRCARRSQSICGIPACFKHELIHCACRGGA